VKLLYAFYNHNMVDTVVGHPYVSRLIHNEKSMLIINMLKSLVKLINILLTIREHNEKKVTTQKQVYNASYDHHRSYQSHRTKMQ